MPHEFTMSAKFPGTCKECKYSIKVGEWIIYDPTTKKAKHKQCPEPDYSGTEQRNIFEAWVKMAQDMEGTNERS